MSKHRAAVFPMVKHPFVVGFLVAELPLEAVEEVEEEEEEEKSRGLKQFPSPEEAYALPASAAAKPPKVKLPSVKVFTAEQRSYAINISRTLAMAYVMDQVCTIYHVSSLVGIACVWFFLTLKFLSLILIDLLFLWVYLENNVTSTIIVAKQCEDE